MNTIKRNLTTFIFILNSFVSIYAQTGITSQTNDSDKVYGGGYLEVQVRPKFTEDINKYIADSIRYPEEARKKYIQGTVYIRFIVEKNGSVSNVKVVRSENESLNTEALRVVSAMPKWTPGKQNGKPVRVNYMIPVHFKL